MFIQIICALIGLCAVGAVIFRNPVYCLLSLISGFIGVATLMIAVGLSYIGFLLLIVYVGAVAILFVFVVMMLNVQHELTKPLIRQWRLLLPLLIAGIATLIVILARRYTPVNIQPHFEKLNFDDFSALLYSKFGVGVLLMGVVLFIGIIAVIAIVEVAQGQNKDLTDYQRIHARTPENSVERKNLEVGTGVQW